MWVGVGGGRGDYIGEVDWEEGWRISYCCTSDYGRVENLKSRLQDNKDGCNHMGHHVCEERMHDHEAFGSLSDVHKHQYYILQKSPHCIGCCQRDNGVKEKGEIKAVDNFEDNLWGLLNNDEDLNRLHIGMHVEECMMQFDKVSSMTWKPQVRYEIHDHMNTIYRSRKKIWPIYL